MHLHLQKLKTGKKGEGFLGSFLQCIVTKLKMGDCILNLTFKNLTQPFA